MDGGRRLPVRRLLRTFCFALVFSLVATSSTSKAGDHLSRQWDALSDEKKQQWHALLHLDPNGQLPRAHPKRFYLPTQRPERSTGRAQFEATVAILAHGSSHNKAELACRYPARYFFANEVLQLGAKRVERACPEQFEDTEFHAPLRLQVGFAEGSDTATASLFGHLFLVLQDTQEIDLSAPSVDFAAQVEPSANFASYVINGMAGGYEGYYYATPLYVHVRKYAYLQRRGIWLYNLKTSAFGRRLAALHLRELEDVSFRYYFLTNNCAYRLAVLADAALGTRVRQEVNPLTAPAEVLRVMKRLDLLTLKEYIPSTSVRLRRLWGALSKGEEDTAKRWLERGPAANDSMALPQEPVARFLYVYFFDNSIRSRVDEIVLDKLGDASGDFNLFEPQEPAASPPHAIQPYRHVGLGYGVLGTESGVVLRANLGYFGLDDSPKGHAPGLYVEGPDVYIHVSKEGRLRLDRADLLDLRSYRSINSVFGLPSSRFGLSIWRTASDEGAREVTVGSVTTGLGVSYLERESVASGLLVGEVNTFRDGSLTATAGLGPEILGAIHGEKLFGVVQLGALAALNEAPYARVIAHAGWFVSERAAIRLRYEYRSGELRRKVATSEVALYF